MSLSTIYLFDLNQLAKFFNNVNKSLKPGGHLILDFPGAPDNFYSWFIDEVALKFEAQLIRRFAPITKSKRRGLIIKHHGYRSTEKEILGIAKASGFELEDKEVHDFLTEFERSDIFGEFTKLLPWTKSIFRQLGRVIPYTRMYDLRKS